MSSFLEAVGGLLKDWSSLLLIALGINFGGSAFWGGLFLALAGAAISRAWERETSIRAGKELPRESYARLFLVAATAFFVSVIVAIVAYAHAPNWSVQVCMAAGGFASRRIVYFVLSVLEHLGRRGDSVAQRILDKYFPKSPKD